VRKTSGSNKSRRKPPTYKARHIHRWQGYLTFHCECGSTHTDRVYVARGGYLFIVQHDDD
jgi:hypothetical protein